MQTKILYLFTRTPLHVGSGASVGAIDQPIQRERHTGFPVIPGTAIKGVLADAYLEPDRKSRTPEGREVFGNESPDKEKTNAKSGGVSFGEAKLLVFPVRSAKGSFVWITSPMILARAQRDGAIEASTVPSNDSDSQAIVDTSSISILSDKISLEEYMFDAKKVSLPNLSSLIEDSLWKEVTKRLVIVSDGMMSYFSKAACEVAQHVKINDEKGTAEDGALFNQENVPAETLFYSVITPLRNGALEKLKVEPVIQVGGDATSGLGFCSTRLT